MNLQLESGVVIVTDSAQGTGSKRSHIGQGGPHGYAATTRGAIALTHEGALDRAVTAVFRESSL